jgi:uncharacterized coiled-coil protein SlyX
MKIDHLGDYILIRNQEESITLDSVKEMGKIAKDRLTIEKRQHELTLLVEKFKKSEFMKTVSNKKTGWITSSSCDSASRWIAVAPKSPSTTFTDQQFRILLNLRLHLEQPDLNSGQKCNCKIPRKNTSPMVYQQCLHCITACAKNGFGIKTHNAINLELSALCNATGLKTKIEPHGCFNTIESLSRYTDKEMNTRPDVLIFKAFNGRSNVIIDTSITTPIPIKDGATMSRDDSTAPEKALHALDRKKIDKYFQIAKDNGLEFITFLFETTGRMYNKSITFLHSIFFLTI